MTKPTSLPEWDTTEVNIIEADATHKEQGWIAPGGIPEKPPFQTFNWWMNLVFKWLSWFNINIAFVGNSIADLRLLDGSSGSGRANLSGYYAPGDGGGGSFWWDATSTETDNNGTIIKVTAVATGRWKRLYSGEINVRWFGAKGDGVTDDSSAIVAAIAASTGKTLFFPVGDYVLTTTETVPADVTLHFDNAAVINGSGTLNINGDVIGDLSKQCFGSSITIIFGTARIVYPEMFYNAEWGAAISSAISSIRAVGGEIKFLKNLETTTPINATNIYTGITFSGAGSGINSGPRIKGVHTGVVFDCTGSRYLCFKDFVIEGDATTIPTVGFLLARESAGSSAGDHIFTNVKTGYNSKFSIAAIYSYASEVLNFYGCEFVNTYGGGKTFVSTATNIFSLTSSFVTIATGSRSNSTLNFWGCSLFNLGGVTSDLFYFDGVIDFHVYGGFWYNATGSVNGRAYIYVATANSASDVISIQGVRGEPGTYAPEYGVFFDNTASRTHTGWGD